MCLKRVRLPSSHIRIRLESVVASISAKSIHRLPRSAHHPWLSAVDHLDGHLVLAAKLGELGLDVLDDKLGHLCGGHIRDEADREFACAVLMVKAAFL